MKLDRIIWGIILLFIGGVLLLENFEIIDFHWRNIWQFWPVGLILIGLNIIFGSSNSKLGNGIMITVVVLSLGTLFVLGQESPRRFFPNSIHWNDGTFDYSDDPDNSDNNNHSRNRNFSIPYKQLDSNHEVSLTLNGDGSDYKLSSVSSELFQAHVKGNDSGVEYFLKEQTNSDSVSTIKFSANQKSKSNYYKGDFSKINFELNEKPIWNFNVNLGAGDADFDLTKFKVKNFKFNGGAIDLSIKMGSLMEETHLNFKAGVSNIEVEIPLSSGCQITSYTALSNRDFEGFSKIKSGVYETPNFKTAKNKIYINLNGGLSNFEVKRKPIN